MDSCAKTTLEEIISLIHANPDFTPTHRSSDFTYPEQHRHNPLNPWASWPPLQKNVTHVLPRAPNGTVLKRERVRVWVSWLSWVELESERKREMKTKRTYMEFKANRVLLLWYLKNIKFTCRDLVIKVLHIFPRVPHQLQQEQLRVDMNWKLKV